MLMMMRMTGFRKVVVSRVKAIADKDPTSGVRLADMLSNSGIVVETPDDSCLVADCLLLAFAAVEEE